jgi:hypothetical protein
MKTNALQGDGLGEMILFPQGGKPYNKKELKFKNMG